ncbi:response regulator [Acidicapsa ligni]|uniref:response regulator n=1 Tax=Acidicapsa ligni TaxID=542300 RepID=UPI0021DF80CE|nr:response regulator [Acidicapsa ligni]
MKNERKKVLLIDMDDGRRETRIKLLNGAGYEVDVRKDFQAAERIDDEGEYDLVILALHFHPGEAASYSDELSKRNPGLPILLLTDYGVFVPRGTLSKGMESGSPMSLMKEVAKMLAGSSHIKEVPAAK